FFVLVGVVVVVPVSLPPPPPVPELWTWFTFPPQAAVPAAAIERRVITGRYGKRMQGSLGGVVAAGTPPAELQRPRWGVSGGLPLDRNGAALSKTQAAPGQP